MKMTFIMIKIDREKLVKMKGKIEINQSKNKDQDKITITF